MIIFEKENGIFYLNTKNTTYAMEVAEGKYLLHRYWGKRLKNPLDKADEYNYMRRCLVPADINGKNSDILPFEYSTWGNADMRIPAAEFTFSDGSRVSRFEYRDYNISAGKNKLARRATG